MTETQKLLIDQLESSVMFLQHLRSKEAVGSDEYKKLGKELAQAQASLTRERAK